MVQNSLRKIPLLPVLVGALLLVIYTVTRITLAVYTGIESAPLGLWPGILAKGLWFDIAVVSVLLAVVFLYEAILPNSWRNSRIHLVLRLVWLWASTALLLFGAVAEITFWMEFSTRFNFIALDYLIYTHEVIGNIRESYPVGLILTAIGALAALIVLLLFKLVKHADSKLLTRSQRVWFGVAAFVLPTLTLTMASIEQMEGQGNAFATELAGNGLFTISAAMRRNELDYDKFYRTIPQETANAVLKEMGVKRKPQSHVSLKGDEKIDATPGKSPFIKKPRNVVLISVESLSASFVGAFGGTQGLTPNIDELARDGMKFEQVFATGTRTVRGLEALSLGTPPIPGQAIVRRLKNEHLTTIGELLEHQGFSPFFFYGGYGYFDNMNAYFGVNDYRVLDRTDFSKETVMFENVWGVADEAMYDNVIRTFDKETATDKPFFVHIMTTSNHRPYTYPDGRIDIPSPGGRTGAVKYTDYAIGKFIRDAKTKPWFKDTLFVIVADHCASVAGKTKLPVEGYRIPLVFYAPELLKPASYPYIVSQIDIAPTLLKILGKSGDEHFFGRNLFGDEAPVERAFISNYQALGYLKNGILTVLLPKQQVESYRVDAKNYETTPAEVDPQLLTEAIAYYQTASRAFKSGELRASHYHPEP
ncbi:MAG: sulfatase [Gallionellales bacterium RIFCSPLOWO2_02_FULL_57_47]|nr:MAG: sulfatase [Gallionellales bacterium RIFCSPLOWO2_02_FULL_57_47]OGT14217.1 MAG: sulfatase [Gallionellales bacterium RIFCSPHIGHO2_02_FULL_57_16]